mgnify:FL=1
MERNIELEIENSDNEEKYRPLKDKIENMSCNEADKTLKCWEEEPQYLERNFIIEKMGKDQDYGKKVVTAYIALFD